MEKWLRAVWRGLAKLERDMGVRIPILAKGVQMERDVMVRNGRTAGECREFFADRLHDDRDAPRESTLDIRDESRWDRMVEDPALTDYIRAWQVRSETKAFCPYHRLAHPGHHCALGDCILGVSRLYGLLMGMGDSGGRERAMRGMVERIMGMGTTEWHAADMMLDNQEGLLPAAAVMGMMQTPSGLPDGSPAVEGRYTVANTLEFKFGAAEAAMAVIEGTKGILLSESGARVYGAPLWTLKEGLKRMFPAMDTDEASLANPEVVAARGRQDAVPRVSHVQDAWPANTLLIRSVNEASDWIRRIPAPRRAAFRRVCANLKLSGDLTWVFIPREWGIRKLGTPAMAPRVWHRRNMTIREPAVRDGFHAGPPPAAAMVDTGLRTRMAPDEQSTRRALETTAAGARAWWAKLERPEPRPQWGVANAPAPVPGPRGEQGAREAPEAMEWVRETVRPQPQAPEPTQAAAVRADVARDEHRRSRTTTEAEESDPTQDETAGGDSLMLRRRTLQRRGQMAEIEALGEIVRELKAERERDRNNIAGLTMQVKRQAEASMAIRAGIEELKRGASEMRAAEAERDRREVELLRREMEEQRMRLAQVPMMMNQPMGIYGTMAPGFQQQAGLGMGGGQQQPGMGPAGGQQVMGMGTSGGQQPTMMGMSAGPAQMGRMMAGQAPGGQQQYAPSPPLSGQPPRGGPGQTEQAARRGQQRASPQGQSSQEWQSGASQGGPGTGRPWN